MTSSTTQANAAKVIALANQCGIDTDEDGDIWGSTNGALLKFASAIEAELATRFRAEGGNTCSGSADDPSAWLIGIDVFRTLNEAQSNVRNPGLRPEPLYTRAAITAARSAPVGEAVRDGWKQVGCIADANGGVNSGSMPPVPFPIWIGGMPSIGSALYVAAAPSPDAHSLTCSTCGADRLVEKCKRPDHCPMIATAYRAPTGGKEP